MDAATQRVSRMSIVDLVTGDECDIQYNPTKLEESMGPRWQRVQVPGLAHERLQYAGGTNNQFSMELEYNGAANLDDYRRMHAARRFLQSRCYARRGAVTMSQGAPSRLLFVWPSFVNIQCVIAEKPKFSYTRFNREGGPTAFTVSLTLEELREGRLYMEDVMALGTVRSSSDTHTENDGEGSF